MGLSQTFLALALTSALTLQAVDKRQIAYLMQSKEFVPSLELYQTYAKEIEKHDFEVLSQLGTLILEEGLRSDDSEKQLISMFGASVAGFSSVNILEAGISSRDPQIQIAAMHLAGQFQDDRCDQLLLKAMASEFLPMRMEAGYLLAARKHRAAVGHIEALMYRLPPQLRIYFPELFALIGTADAIAVLRKLMEDPQLMVRVAAVLSAAMFQRDDLLPTIRSLSTHLNIAEQEACSTALGYLKDSKAMAKLKKLATSPATNVQLAASRSLHLLGDASAKSAILNLAKAEDPFAIAILASIPGSEDLLAELAASDDLQVRLNATLSLLTRKDPRCVPHLLTFLCRDSRDIGFQPQFSIGSSLRAWKVVPSISHQKDKQAIYDLTALSMHLREVLLKESLELPERDFLRIAASIFESGQNDLIPLLVSLLQNLQTPQALALLQQQATKIGAPFTRTYCHLALYRLKQSGPHEHFLRDWMSRQKKSELIRFRPMLTRDQKLSDAFDLTPEEHSRLLLETYQAFAERNDAKSIDILIDVIKEGNPKNRPALAGLLLRAIQ